MHETWFDRFALIMTVVIFAFLLLPLLVVIVMSFNSSSDVSWPPSGFSLTWYREVVANERIVDVAKNSLKLALLTSLFSTIIGTLAGFALMRYSFLGRKPVLVLSVLPILIPSILLALGLVIVTTTVLGQKLSMRTLLIGHITITLPFVILIVASRASSLDRRLEDASRDLGAGWLRTMIFVVLPALSPAIRGAFLFSFVISMNEVILALFLAGSDQTLPGFMFSQFQRVITPEIDAISTLMVMMAVLVLVIESAATRAVIARNERNG